MAAKLDKDPKSSPKKPAKDTSSAPKASSKSKQPLDEEEVDDLEDDEDDYTFEDWPRDRVPSSDEFIFLRRH